MRLSVAFRDFDGSARLQREHVKAEAALTLGKRLRLPRCLLRTLDIAQGTGDVRHRSEASHLVEDPELRRLQRGLERPQGGGMLALRREHERCPRLRIAVKRMRLSEGGLGAGEIAHPQSHLTDLIVRIAREAGTMRSSSTPARLASRSASAQAPRSLMNSARWTRQIPGKPVIDSRWHQRPAV